MGVILCECGKTIPMSREHAGPTTCPECGRTLATLFEEARDSDSSKIQTGFPAPLRDPRDYSDRPRRRRAYLQDKPVSEKGPNLWLWIGVPVGTVVIASTVIAYFVVQAALEPERKLEQHLELGIRRDEFRDNMKQIGKAMKAFHAAHGSLPSPGFSGDPAKPDSKPLLSWRVALLPYLNEKALFDEFHLDESWDSPHNAKLLLKIPAVYRPIKVDQATRHMTPIQLITGPDTVYPDAKTRPRVPESFPDGETETIIFVEAENLAPWTRPVDVVYDPKGPLPKFGTLGKDAPEARGFGGLGPCFIVGLGDGSIRFIYQSRVSERTIRSAINPNDGLPIGPDWK